MTHEDIPNLRTPGRIAEEIGESLSRVLYVLSTRPHIRPAARAGVIRLYDRRAVDSVRTEIEAMDSRRTPKRMGVVG